MNNRRTFLTDLSKGATLVAISAIGIPLTVRAADLPEIDENDPQAKAFRYVHDTVKVDQEKFPKHVVVQKCNNCQLFQGKSADALGGCPLFVGKSVAGPGWCSAYIKKI